MVDIRVSHVRQDYGDGKVLKQGWYLWVNHSSKIGPYRSEEQANIVRDLILDSLDKESVNEE